MESGDLAQRAAIAGVSCRIVDDYVVALRLRREVAVHNLGFDPAILFSVFLETLERGLEFCFDCVLVSVAGSPRTPLQSIELVQIEQVEDFVERDVANDARTPERGLRDRVIGRDTAALATGVTNRDVFADSSLEEDVVACVLEILDHEFFALLR